MTLYNFLASGFQLVEYKTRIIVRHYATYVRNIRKGCTKEIKCGKWCILWAYLSIETFCIPKLADNFANMWRWWNFSHLQCNISKWYVWNIMRCIWEICPFNAAKYYRKEVESLKCSFVFLLLTPASNMTWIWYFIRVLTGLKKYLQIMEYWW